MIVSRAHPSNLEGLRSLVQEAAKGARSVVMQAGHFLLYYDIVEDRLLPCISEELASPRHELLRREAGEFPSLSWALGLELLDAVASDLRHVMVVVNDWQYVPKDIDRRVFYEGFQRLPNSYARAIDSYAGRIRLLEPPASAGTRPFFGEMNLRNQYHKVVGRMLEDGLLPQSAVVERLRDGVVCSLPDSVGRVREVYCSNKTGDCSAEIAQMIRLAAQQARCDCFINLYPAVCRDFVEQGTELGEDLLRNGVPTVVNVGLLTHGVSRRADMLESADVTVHRFATVTADIR